MAAAQEHPFVLAQAGPMTVAAAADRPLAGHVEQVAGQVFVLKLDGSRVLARAGAQIFEGDIVVTQAGGGATVAFDRAVVALGGDARMLVETGGAQPVFFVLQGQFGMQTVPGAPNTPDQVTVRTPVSSVVLRRGRMLGRAAAEAVSNSFVLLPNADGGIGAMNVTTAAGAVLLDRAMQGTTVVSLFRSPMPALDRDLASLQGEFSGFLAGWLPTARPVATSSLLPDTLSTLLGFAGDTFAQRGARLLDLIFPPAAAAAAFELAPGPAPDNIFMPPASLPVQTVPPTPPADPGAPNTPQNLSIDFNGGGATVVGGTAFDMLTLTADPVQANSISIGADAQGRLVIVNAAGTTILVDNVEELSVSLGAASDVIVLGDLSATDIADSTVIIHAGAGNDSIDGALAGKRLVLFGEDGNDTLTGGSRNDDLYGGPGDDLLTGNGGNDLIDGGAGSDTASFAGAAGPVSVSLAAGTATGQGTDTLTGIEHVIGSPFADLLTGDGNANSLSGGGGNDTLSGGAGDDTLAGGADRDTASFAGASGPVAVSLAAGTASGAGTDSLTDIEDLVGSAFNDTLTGSDAANAIDGGLGNDAIDAMGGDDSATWRSGDGTDTLAGGSGTDRLDATVSGSISLAGSGATAVLTSNGSVSMTGVEVVSLVGSGGSDSFAFGDVSATAVTTISADAGAGTDSASFASAGAGVTVDLAAGTATGFSQFLGFESVTGSSAADTLRGDGGANTLDGGLGNDSLDARGGNDVVAWSTGAGNDAIEGGSGSDTLTASISGAVSLTRSGGSGVLSGNGTATVTGVELYRLTGGGGNDSFTLGNLAGVLDAVEIIGGTGTDTAIFTDVPGGVTVDLAAGTASLNGGIVATLQSIESVVGSDQSDTLRGGAGNDVLTGGDSADTIDGRDGDDRIVYAAGDGADAVEGGLGQDTLDVDLGAVAVALGASGSTLLVDVGTTGSSSQLMVRTVETVRLTSSLATITVGGAGSTIVLGNLTGTEVTAVEVRSGAGNDLIDASGATQALRLLGEGDNDTLIGGGGNDTLQGDGGTDTVSYAGATAAVVVDLDAGTASGASIGSDSLNTIERVVGSGFADTITGSSGNNTLMGGLGDDILDGGAGFDMVDYSGASAAIGVDLAQSVQSATGGSGTDTLSRFEGIIGSAFDDTLTGDGNGNLLLGGAGDDSLVGGDGNDTLMGGAGTNTFDGGLGTDTADFSDLATGQTIDLNTYVSIENAVGGSGGDSLTGTAGANLLSGGAGNDTLSGNGGLDTLVGGLGADRLEGTAGDAQFFRFGAAGEGGDSIVAFETGTDRLQVSSGGFGVASIVDGQNFFLAAAGDPLGVNNAAFIFDSGTGNFAYDSDGDGAAAAVVLATLQTGTVQATDLQVF